MQAFYNALIVISVFLQASQVMGHGFVSTFSVVGGKSYAGNPPGEGTTHDPSVVRQVQSKTPVKGVDDPDMACGTGAKPALLAADVNPGDTVAFSWRGGTGESNWVHEKGPIVTYMASCGSVPCAEFDALKAKWFKVADLMQKSDGTWYMADVMHQGAAIEVKIPSTLAAGNYLIRQEMIAIHLANTIGGVEIFPSCTQLKVGGSQTGKPDASELVSFPGAYKADSPALFIPEVFEARHKFVVPGPAIAKIAGGKGGSGPTSSSTATTTKAVATETTTSSTTSTSTAASSTPSPVMNAAKPPSTSTASQATPKPTTVRKCKRKRSERIAKRAASVVAIPSPSFNEAPSSPLLPHRSHARHSRRALRRFEHGSHAVLGRRA
ncbi:glycosyl hydrolase family 61-domain-containing protein [Ephemerocybe angulata]|uniref:lytic cellulose monooxygenase (C4-dehydrogenating) n=1 Tax=Ephemerocybe angulata TaxID=980116 RepID=A0A8H6MB53_9AGAR|nr:glycosyl hydrolase family 61-domain-containing protein [Tulosesus angulatus]